MNLNEAGMVELSPGTPQEKQAVTATVSDLDRITGSVTWEWARSPNQSAWTDIATGVSSSGTTSRYTPQTADVGQYLRATATYIDGTGTEQTEAATTTDPVQAAPQVSLALSSDSIAERGGVSTVTAALDRAVGVATRVTVTATAESPAVAGDFRQSGTTLTIPANKISQRGGRGDRDGPGQRRGRAGDQSGAGDGERAGRRPGDRPGRGHADNHRR